MPGVATRVDPADRVTGGSTAPDEDDGFGHGVDGLTPRSEIPPGGSQATTQPSANGGATAPSDAAPAASSTSNPSAAAASSAETVPGSFK